MYCPHCGKEVKDQARMCVACGKPLGDSQSAVKAKDKTVAVILAVFFAFWTWCYTYKKDAWKFWLNLGLFLVSIGFWGPVAWIWAIIDVSLKPQDYYHQFPFWCGLPNKNPNVILKGSGKIDISESVSNNDTIAVTSRIKNGGDVQAKENDIARIDMISDSSTGYIYAVHITDKRIIFEYILETKGIIIFAFISGFILVGVGAILTLLIAKKIVINKYRNIIKTSSVRLITTEQILKSNYRNYSINIIDIQQIILKSKKILLIKSNYNSLKLGFEKNQFNNLSSILSKLFPDKILIQ